MMCQFCKQDVENPCQDERDVQRRAENHIERCENALNGNGAMHRTDHIDDTDM